METAATTTMPEEGTPVVEQQEESHHTAQHDSTLNPLIRPSMDDATEDYGPLKKKHKYRDERDTTTATTGNGSFSTSPNTTAVNDNDTSITLDSSIQEDNDVLHTPAAVDALGGDAPISDLVVADTNSEHEQQRDLDHLSNIDTTAETSLQDSQYQQQQQQQQSDIEQHEHDNKQEIPRDTASSPSSMSEKTRKHNFYVPSREVAFLLDSVSAEASSSQHSHAYDLLSLPTSTSTFPSTANDAQGQSLPDMVNGSESASPLLDPAQINANALLATGMPITGRQAAKIAAMEAKEKAKLAKEKELEEARMKKKAELERKKVEAAKKKAEKEGTQTSYGNTANPHASARRDSSASAAAAGTSPFVAPLPLPTADNTNAPPTKAAPKKRAPARKGSNKSSSSTITTKQESPVLPMPEAVIEHTIPSTDIKVGSPSSIQPPLSAGAAAHDNLLSSAQSSTSNLPLPPMHEQETEPEILGFIPYASEGARAAALAKAAKQQKNQGSPPSSIPVPLPATQSGGRGSKGGANGRKGSSSAGNNGSPAALHQLLSAAGGEAQTGNQQGGAKKGRSKAQALAAAAAASNAAGANYSGGRASPTNALEHAAAAIDAVLDAGALARAQAQAEEEEVDDRLYCICQQLYDPERLMIACDRCDNWYHADCINIDETQINLIDLFICPICEKDSDLHTVSKSRCAREECSEAAVKLSKYCSDRCGILVAASKLEKEPMTQDQSHNAASMNLLWDAVASVKKLETVIRTVEGDLMTSNQTSVHDLELLDDAPAGHSQIASNGLPPPFSLQARVNEEQQRLDKLQTNLADYVTRREALENSLALANARLTYFNYAKGKWRLSWVDKALQQQSLKPSAAGKKAISAKAKAALATKAANAAAAAAAAGGGGEEIDKLAAAPPDAPCGFDVRLVWDDRDWQEWLESEEGRKIMEAAEEYMNAGPNADAGQYIKIDQNEAGVDGTTNEEEEGLVCTLTKKKCDRHAAWQKLRQADFDVEKNALERQLGLLTDSERRIRRRAEDIEDFLRRANGKLSAMSSSAATPLPNGDDGNEEGQDVMMEA